MAGGGGMAGGGINPEVGIVRCGGQPCSVTMGNVCCISLSGQQCVASAMCGGGLAAPQACDGPEDCPAGQRCCVGFPQGASCSAMACPSGQQELCHAAEDCDGNRACTPCSFPGSPPTNVCTNAC